MSDFAAPKCTDCRHSMTETIETDVLFCGHPGLECATGEREGCPEARWARTCAYSCGPEAKLFEAKVDKP